jgi:hypothetical protein
VNKVFNKEWFVAAGVRALKTFAQAALAMFTVGQAITAIGWLTILSVSTTAAVYSVLMSIVGLPEATKDGTLQIDTTDPTKDTFRIQLDGPVDSLIDKKKVTLCVDTSAKLS